MQRTPTYIHPRRLAALKAHFQTLCTIQHRTIIYDAFNQEVITYSNSPNLTAIPAYKEPATAGSGEQRTDQEVIVTNRWYVYLQGYYPTIEIDDRATLDGVPHNILNVVHDDSKTLTVLSTELVNAASDQLTPL